MKRRQFLSLAALPLVAAPLVVAAPRPYVVEEVFQLFDWHDTVAIAWRMSDGTRHALHGQRLPSSRFPARVYPQHLPYVTEEEKAWLREEMRERFAAP